LPLVAFFAAPARRACVAALRAFALQPRRYSYAACLTPPPTLAPPRALPQCADGRLVVAFDRATRNTRAHCTRFATLP